ncbi:MAG: sialate O-acetylesterase, partial [Akkermansiaceae bacterium]|nr:sialate O-acetylesterase [Akkermansiaceae bacterium]
MTTKRNTLARWILLAALAVPLGGAVQAKPLPANGKLKIFILAGQSNMVGFGQVAGSPGTMETYTREKPEDYGHLVGKDGKPVVRDDVW